MTDLFEPLTFSCGARMKNRIMLAPLTNLQSLDDGRLSDDEFRWLTMRAQGGFGLTMTCASHVQAVGQGFRGQLGCFADYHLEGLARLAEGIKARDSLAVVQLHHAGMRSPPELIGEAPVCPSEHEETGARALSLTEIERLAEDFIDAACRAEAAGFDGVEIHGAHGYVLCQFLSPEINRRSDRYGGSADNRARIIVDIIDGIRSRCAPGFLLGLRLSAERFGLRVAEIRDFTARLLADDRLDFLDLSLWDTFKEAEEDAYKGRTLLSWFTELERGNVRLGAAGGLLNGRDMQRALDANLDFVTVGTAGILHHDLPVRIREDRDFEPAGLPVSADHLRAEGLGDAFIDYLRKRRNFVA